MGEGNPYSRMVALMRKQRGEIETDTPAGSSQVAAGAVRMRLGTVTDVSPLTVSIAGVSMPASTLRVNGRLAKGAASAVYIAGSDQSFGASVTQVTLALNVGDQVLMLTADDQVFYIVMKVVAAE